MPRSLSTLFEYGLPHLQRVSRSYCSLELGLNPLRPASSPLYYITALTALFESIAMIVDQHQPVVEKYYGRGKMRLVVQRLLEEADRVTKTLRVNWEEDRSIRRKVSSLVAPMYRPLDEHRRFNPDW